MTEKSTREILEKPFDSSLIRQRRGPVGKMLDYVEGAHYIKRLNKTYEGRWDFKVLQFEITKSEVFVLGELQVDGITKQTFGGSALGSSIADSLKSASTDALKKACSMLGIGLHLYSNDELDGSREEKAPTIQQIRPITEKQLSAIGAIARSFGWGRSSLDEYVRAKFHCSAMELSSRQASEIISELKRNKSNEM